MKDNYRSKFVSVVIQPKMETSEFWLSNLTDREINDKLIEISFPTPDQMPEAFNKIRVLTVNAQNKKPVTHWAYGTETSEVSKIPHYQIYLEFDVLVRLSSVYEELDKFFEGKAHIVTKKVYTNQFEEYCLKETSIFEFKSDVYYNIKTSSKILEKTTNKLVELRPKLKMIKDNYFMGQKLLKAIALSDPDDRTGVWLADVIGGTGKTAFFQTIIDDPQLNGLYLRISEGVERLLAKLRRKIENRLNEGKGYPSFVWINFGRTVEETSLKAFSDFAEQIIDGMLDDNFGNTGGKDFIALPYMNVIVSANTPPNLHQLTGDRLKLLTLFPIYENIDTYKLKESLLIPIFVETRVRIQKKHPNVLQYKFFIRPQTMDFIIPNFSDLVWFPQLMENLEAYHEFQKTEKAKSHFYKSKMESEWFSSTPYNVQSDIYDVYVKALHASTHGEKDVHMYYEASSFNKMPVFKYSSKENVVDLDLKNEIGVTISKPVSDMKNRIKTEL